MPFLGGVRAGLPALQLAADLGRCHALARARWIRSDSNSAPCQDVEPSAGQGPWGRSPLADVQSNLATRQLLGNVCRVAQDRADDRALSRPACPRGGSGRSRVEAGGPVECRQPLSVNTRSAGTPSARERRLRASCPPSPSRPEVHPVLRRRHALTVPARTTIGLEWPPLSMFAISCTDVRDSVHTELLGRENVPAAVSSCAWCPALAAVDVVLLALWVRFAS